MRVVQHCGALGVAVADPNIGAGLFSRKLAKSSAAMQCWSGKSESREMIKALGLMSGTSLDGIDVAMIETDGERQVILGPSLTIPYQAAFRERLRSVLGGAGAVVEVEDELTRLHAAAVGEFVQHYPETALDIVGFHGHTIL